MPRTTTRTGSIKSHIDDPEKPVFVPLRTAYFNAFKAGAKTEEYRPLGHRWNAEVCRIGRAVTLSHGYSGERLHGTITGFRTELGNTLPGWQQCYPERRPTTLAAVITITLTETPE